MDSSNKEKYRTILSSLSLSLQALFFCVLKILICSTNFQEEKLTFTKFLLYYFEFINQNDGTNIEIDYIDVTGNYRDLSNYGGKN